MSSRGSKKKLMGKSAQMTPQEKKRQARKDWWKRNQTLVVLGILGLLLLAGIVVITQASKSTEEPPVSTGSYMVLNFSSSICKPCEQLAPVIKTLQSKYQGKIDIRVYDINKLQDARFAQQYRVSATPTLVFLDKNGREVKRMLGYQSQETLESVFQSLGWTV